jgi:acyl-CoA thioesterase FadM
MVRFGDTDPAKIVYTVKFLDFAMDALDGWFAAVLEHDWTALNNEYGVSCPFVRCGLDFKAPLRPGQEVATEILVTRLGNSSLQFQVLGFRPDDVLSFTAQWTCAFVDPASLQSVAIPPIFAGRISAYIEACSASGAARR